MSAQLDPILVEASCLSASDRAQLALCLISSLDQVDHEDLNQAWLESVEAGIKVVAVMHQSRKPGCWHQRLSKKDS